MSTSSRASTYEKVQPVIPRVLSFVEKTSQCKEKVLTTLKLGPVSVIAFRIALTKLDGFVIRLLFVSTNGIKMQILDVVGVKSSTLTDYCSSYWFVHQKLNTYLALFVLCGVSHLSWFQGFKYIPPSIWSQVKNFKKWFIRS